MKAAPKTAFLTLWLRLRKMPHLISLGVIALILLLALLPLLGVELTPYSFDQTSNNILTGPTYAHLMGTDELGRDVFERIIYGSRLSMAIGFITAMTAFVIGTIYGSIAGFYGGKIDGILMRGIDIAYSLPDLLVMILVGMLTGRSTFGILLALALVSWMGTARLTRAKFMELQHEEFIEAARALGQSHLAIIIRHLLPNALGPILVALTFTVPSAVLSESTLSFIGLGLSPPECSWGTLANDGWRSLRTHPHLILFPSFFIFVTVASFNFLGDGMRDFIDPRIKVGAQGS